MTIDDDILVCTSGTPGSTPPTPTAWSASSQTTTFAAVTRSSPPPSTPAGSSSGSGTPGARRTVSAAGSGCRYATVERLLGEQGDFKVPGAAIAR